MAKTWMCTRSQAGEPWDVERIGYSLISYIIGEMLVSSPAGWIQSIKTNLIIKLKPTVQKNHTTSHISPITAHSCLCAMFCPQHGKRSCYKLTNRYVDPWFTWMSSVALGYKCDFKTLTIWSLGLMVQTWLNCLLGSGLTQVVLSAWRCHHKPHSAYSDICCFCKHTHPDRQNSNNEGLLDLTLWTVPDWCSFMDAVRVGTH